VARTNEYFRNLTETYWNSRLNLAHVIGPYFDSHHDVQTIREMMKETGAIISGSTALQFFARETYGDSDLDIYVEDNNSNMSLSCLMNLGYNVLPNAIGTKDGLEPGDGYPGELEIEKVITLVKQGNARFVQLVCTRREPVLAVLQFHSSKSTFVQLNKILMTVLSLRYEFHYCIKCLLLVSVLNFLYPYHACMWSNNKKNRHRIRKVRETWMDTEKISRHFHTNK
jgi:hypothetical protein